MSADREERLAAVKERARAENIKALAAEKERARAENGAAERVRTLALAEAQSIGPEALALLQELTPGAMVVESESVTPSDMARLLRDLVRRQLLGKWCHPTPWGACVATAKEGGE